MILLNELSGNITTKSISLTGNLSTKSVLLTGSLLNGGTRSLPAYEGSYTVTPSGSVQILYTKDTRMADNITIEAIPGTMENNWGRITWNGSYMTVS